MILRMLAITGITGWASAPAMASSGQISQLFADPHKVVLQLRDEAKAVTGRCGGEFFDLDRTNQNFNELSWLSLNLRCKKCS